MLDLRILDGFSNYRVSPEGLILNIKSKKYLKNQNSRNNYQTVTLYSDEKKSKKFRVHRLVALLFLDNPENKPDVNHKDGVKTNNHFSNLEWVTVAENNVHANIVVKYPRKAGKYTGQLHSKAKKFLLVKGNEKIELYGYSELATFLNLKRAYIFKKIKLGESLKGYEIKEVEKPEPFNENLTETIVFRVTTSELLALKQYSEKTETPMSMISRTLLNTFLKKEGCLT